MLFHSVCYNLLSSRLEQQSEVYNLSIKFAVKYNTDNFVRLYFDYTYFENDLHFLEFFSSWNSFHWNSMHIAVLFHRRRCN